MACTIEDLNPSEIIVGCTDPLALNFDQTATVDSGLCFYSGQTSGCTDPSAINYNPEAIFDDCSCEYIPCPPTSAITISAGVAYYTPPPKPTTPSDPGPTVPPSPLETDKSLSPQQGSTITPSEPGTTLKIPNTFIPLSEFCCKEEFVGQPVSWNTETQQCELLGGSPCPTSVYETITGLLVDAETNLPVSQDCCEQYDGYSYTLNPEDGKAGCFKDQPTPIGPCELLFTDVIYVNDTVVYDPTTITIDPGGDPIEGCTIFGATNYNPSATVDDGSCFFDDGPGTDGTLDCFTIDSWTRGYVSDTPTYASGYDDSIGSSTFNPDTGYDHPQNIYLLTFIIETYDQLQIALSANLQEGQDIEISGVPPSNGSTPCYTAGIDTYLNGTPKISKLLYNSQAGQLKIVTNFVIDPYVDATSTNNFCSVIDSSGTACPVILNVEGCTDPNAINYDPNATVDNGSCEYNPNEIPGCTDINATNYNPSATVDDGSCEYTTNPGDCCPEGVLTVFEFTSYNFSNIAITNDGLGFGIFLPCADGTQNGNCTPWWSNSGNNITNPVCGNSYDYQGYFLNVFGSQITNLDPALANIAPGESACVPVILSDSFWNNLDNSCYQSASNGQIIIPPPGTPVTVLGREGVGGAYVIDVQMPNSAAPALGLTPLSPIDFSEACTTNQVGDYCACLSTSNFGGGGGNKTAGIFVGNDGKALPKSPINPLVPKGVDPCDTEVVIPPEENDNFENLSEDCCLTLGADLGWEYIDGVCYWNPPTPTTTTQFGLSENDILVEDIECDELEIKASFYLERPDDINCEPDAGDNITASLSVYTGDSMDNTVIPVNTISTFSLAENGYCQWTDISSTIINNNQTPFKVKLILNGVKECCEYDIFVDDIQVNCIKQDVVTTNNYFDCPGFKLNRVIDNKKSWVKNTETPINRVFAPSSDADLPWRYTNYLEQSGVYEKDSRLVLNSKEVDLVFNMRRKEKPCPNGYTYNPNNDTCFKIETTCPSGFTLSGETCISGVTTTSATTVVTTIDRVSDSCNIDLSVFDLLEYKKNFQNYWVKFIEQFIPATTIFVSGEKWSNRDNEICPTIEPCGYDNVFSKTDLGLKNAEGGTTYTDNKNNNKEVPVYTSDDDVYTEKNGDYGDNNKNEPIILPNFVGYFLQRNPSILNSGLLTLKRGELSLLNSGKKLYQNKFTPKITVFNS